jgi:hypothetical protein
MRRTIAVVVVALATLPAASAHAQSRDDLARADALFNAGKALIDSGQYADACAKFAESKHLAPGLGVTLYLADCYEHVGRNASAWAEFRSAEGLARERSDKRADVARDRARALESKLNRLTIAVAPSIPRSGLQVLRDGIPVPQEEFGLPMPVDPGAHVVVVSATGHNMRTFDAHVDAEGQAATVHIDTLDEASTATSTATPTPTPTPTPTATQAPTTTSFASVGSEPPPRSDTGATRRWIGVGVGVLGIVGVGVGSVFGLVAKSKLDESNGGTNPPCDARNRCNAAGLSLRKDADGAASVATIAFAAGGVAFATGVVIYLTAPHGNSTTGVVVAPAFLAGGGGAIARGSF